ncbi:hypothetical protein REPUB_Repub13aG0195300 [Reevesia pubescens]
MRTTGWVKIGSLDGFLYSFSHSGTLKKFPKAAALDSVIQFSPFLDCSGYAVYFCQTEMEGKVVHMNDQYTYVSAMKPKSSVFTLMVPATGKIYWSQRHHGLLLSSLSKSDLQNFVLDEVMLLAFVTASNIGNRLPCRDKGLKLASSCSQGTSKRLSIYTGNRRAILLFLLFESLFLVALAAVSRFCCIFWRKKKLHDQDLGRFLEKRRSLEVKKKAFDRTITELEQKAAEEAVANEAIEKLGDLVRERQGIERKLATTYSLVGIEQVQIQNLCFHYMIEEQGAILSKEQRKKVLQFSTLLAIHLLKKKAAVREKLVQIVKERWSLLPWPRQRHPLKLKLQVMVSSLEENIREVHQSQLPAQKGI